MDNVLTGLCLKVNLNYIKKSTAHLGDYFAVVGWNKSPPNICYEAEDVGEEVLEIRAFQKYRDSVDPSCGRELLTWNKNTGEFCCTETYLAQVQQVVTPDEYTQLLKYRTT